MECKQALDVLIKLAKKPGLTAKEREAVLTAIGALDMGSLVKSRYKRIFKNQKAKKEKSTQW
jgi:hypothetical protein